MPAKRRIGPIERKTLDNIFETYGQVSMIARELGLHPASVRDWYVAGFPAIHVLDLERILDIPRGQIRPDLYPVETKKKPKKRAKVRA